MQSGSRLLASPGAPTPRGDHAAGLSLDNHAATSALHFAGAFKPAGGHPASDTSAGPVGGDPSAPAASADKDPSEMTAEEKKAYNKKRAEEARRKALEKKAQEAAQNQ